MTHAIWGALTAAGTYSFTAAYVPHESEDLNAPIALTLESSASTDAAVATDVATVLARMKIRWLRPLSSAIGPWSLNRQQFADYFTLAGREWLIGERLIRPVFDETSTFNRTKHVLRFVIAPFENARSDSDRKSEWAQVERLCDKIQYVLATGVTSDDFQQVGSPRPRSADRTRSGCLRSR